MACWVVHCAFAYRRKTMSNFLTQQQLLPQGIIVDQHHAIQFLLAFFIVAIGFAKQIQILNICSHVGVKLTRLAIPDSGKNFTVRVQGFQDWLGIDFHRSSKDVCLVLRRNLPKKLVQMRSFMNQHSFPIWQRNIEGVYAFGIIGGRRSSSMHLVSEFCTWSFQKLGVDQTFVHVQHNYQVRFVGSGLSIDCFVRVILESMLLSSLFLQSKRRRTA